MTPHEAVELAREIIDRETGPNVVDTTIILRKLQELQDRILREAGYGEIIDLREGHSRTIRR